MMSYFLQMPKVTIDHKFLMNIEMNELKENVDMKGMMKHYQNEQKKTRNIRKGIEGILIILDMKTLAAVDDF